MKPNWRKLFLITVALLAVAVSALLPIAQAQFIDRILRPCGAGVVPLASVIVNPNSTGNIDIKPCTGGTLTINGAAVGSVNSGTQFQLAYYATTGTAVSGNSAINTDASNRLIENSTLLVDTAIVNANITGGNVAANITQGAVFDVVVPSANSNGVLVTGYSGGGNNDADIMLATNRGTPTAGSAMLSGDRLGEIDWQGFGVGGYPFGTARIVANARETFTAATAATSLSFFSTPSGSIVASERLRIDQNGLLGFVNAGTVDTALTRNAAGVLEVDNGTAGSFAGFKAATYLTGTNCSSSASPAVCGSAAAGSVVVAAGATTVVVNTTAMTTNSQVLLTYDSSLGTKLGVTCNTTEPALYGVTARVGGTSFTITSSSPVTNPACFSYIVIN